MQVEGCERVRSEALAVDVHRLTVQEGHEDAQVLLHVAGGFVEAHAPHPLHHDLVGQADTQNETVPGRQLHREGLLGQHHGVAGIDRDDAGAQLYAGNLRPGGSQQRQRVGPEDLHCEGVIETGVGKAA